MINKEISKLIINKGTKKCFVFDLDGTIIFGSNRLTEENEKLLLKIKDAGHELIFATGRTLRDFKLIMPTWTHEQMLVLFSGSLALKQDKIFHREYIANKYVPGILELLNIHGKDFIIDSAMSYYHPNNEHFVYDYQAQLAGDYRINSLEQIMKHDIYKILVLDYEMHGLFMDYLSDKHLSIKLHSYDKCFDIVPHGVNKYNGIKEYIELDYDYNDVFVFGNDLNDYELLLNFNNSVLLGGHKDLINVASLNLPYNNELEANFTKVINSILAI